MSAAKEPALLTDILLSPSRRTNHHEFINNKLLITQWKAM
jgi:hypothetical protein